MSDEVKVVTATLVGRKMELKVPNEDQLIAWMGIAGSLSDGRDLEEGVLTEDVTLLLDALLDSFVDPADRRVFRRAMAMGQARLPELFLALVSQQEEKPPAPKKAPARVRRAR